MASRSRVEADARDFQQGLAAALADLELRTEDDLMRLGLRTQNAARRLCPVDTGRLRASIQAVKGKDGKGVYVDIGTNVEYAIPVEFGTDRMDAQPFLRPALNQAVDEMKRLGSGS